MKFMQTEKKQLLIYVIIAYGITYVMGLLMWYSYGKGLDLSAFPNAQMLYPAAGVMMAYLITKKGFLHILCSSHGGAGCLHGGFCSGSPK